MRSQLFVPADSEKKLEKGLASGADCLFLDLEDSVALGAKPKARRLAAEFLAEAQRRSPRPLLYVRVNGLESGLIETDLEAVAEGAPDGVVLPKCVNGAALQHLGAMLAVKEAQADLADGAIKIIPIVTETAAALFNMGTYAGASQRLAGLTWGAEDLAACLGAEENRDEDGAYRGPYALARNLTLLAASAADVPAIDTVYLNFRDLAGFRLECAAARRDGFIGKMAIHPAQVEIINEVFTPSEASIARAHAVVAAFAADPEAGVVSLEGEMLDAPHLKRARRLLERFSNKSWSAS
ncbi:HpcH/HpaI aldolase/citrate lyase family protein [Methylocapsa aurea]|uniref:HpcH/HpaI aldolase/citrate lyase family protein n=1 Tax=Methylocapsa aurea TaxID=663610 RepID=UPI00055F97E6|nr:CoA ester lyase [Methylocapsa aurea]